MKIYVSELSQESQNLFVQLGKEQELTIQEIQDGLDSKILDLKNDSEQYLGFRICDNPKCKELFNDGFIMQEDFHETYCSCECAETVHEDLQDEDYGTDIIYSTEWIPE